MPATTFPSTFTPNASLPAFNLPLTSLIYSKPNEEISEYEKFKDDGYFFTRMSRWITWNFYNPLTQKFYNGDTSTTRVNDGMQENFAYYFGVQENKTFAYTQTINENETIQAVYVPDQKIRQIVDSMIGTAKKIINPIEDSISATVLSKDSIKGKEQLRRKLEIKKHLNELLSQAQGVTFAPGGIDEVDEDDDIDEIVDKYKDEEALKLIRLGQSIYYNNALKVKCEESVLHEIVNNISNFVIDVKDDKAAIKFYPSYNSIIDTRATDDFLSDAMLSGFVEFLTPAQIFDRWGNEMTDDEKNFINNMSQKNYYNWLDCYNYYNVGCPNIVQWCQETGKIACVTTYWIGKKDLPYRKKKTQFGGTKLQFIDSEKDYAVTNHDGTPVKENGKHVTQKGSEIRSEKGMYAVHQNTIIGNYCSKGYGYFPLQLRPQGNKQRPMLPTVQYVHRLVMGYFRSVVSRLRHYSDEKGRLKLKIQELTGRDMGKVYVLYASKLGLTDDATLEAFKDFKTIGFTIINDTGANVDEVKKGVTADMLDFSLQPTIREYIELCREQDREMEAIAATSDSTLGQQPSYIGKSVQENTIAQSTLGQLPLFDGMLEHWRRLMQQTLNYEKVLNAGKEKIVQTSANQAYIININKALKWEDVGLNIEIADPFEPKEKQLLNDGLFSYAQNGGTLESAEALYNIVKILRGKSAREQEKHLEDFIEKKKKEIASQQQQQEQGQMQHEASMQSAAKEYEIGLKQMTEMNANYRTEVQAVMSALSKMQQDLAKGSEMLLSQLQKEAPVSPLEQQASQVAAQ